MKTSTYYFALIIATVCLVGLGSCKKISNKKGTKDDQKVEVVNPNTAQTTCDYDFDESSLTSAGWTKTYEENFDGDLSNWTKFTGGVQNELQCNEPANATVQNGVLQISTKKETVIGPEFVNSSNQKSFDYTSAWIASKATFATSDATPKVRIVARIKVAGVYGSTSLFYSYGLDWPTNGEIDMMEVRGDIPNRYATDYAYGSQSKVNLVNNGALFNPTDASLANCYHVYEMEWTKNALISYLDGKLVETKTVGGHVPDLFGKAQYLSFSLPIGGLFYSNLNNDGIQTGTMYVDYVKVFTSN